MKRSILLATCLVLVLAADLSAQLPGAAWTSLNDGTTVNANLYNAKVDVYLNGGPQNPNGKGLFPGLYFFQVTNPNGAVLLSTDPAECRVVQVVEPVFTPTVGPPENLGGRIMGIPGTTPSDVCGGTSCAVPGGSVTWTAESIPGGYPAICQTVNGGNKPAYHFNGLFDDTNFSVAVQLCGGRDTNNDGVADAPPNNSKWCYADTPNNGGEYKAWLIPRSGQVVTDAGCSGTVGVPNTVLMFDSSCSKTDNFKVRETTIQKTVVITGKKYYDADGNGQNGSETGIPGWPIDLYTCDSTFTTCTLVPNDSLPHTTMTGTFGVWSWQFRLNNGGSSVNVKACEASRPAGWQQTGPLNGATAGVFTAGSGCWTGTITQESCPVDSGTGLDTCTGLDFFNNIPLSGLKYYDTNKDGDRDNPADEPGLPDWTVNLSYCDSGIVETETNCPGAALDAVDETATTGAGGMWSAIANFPITNYRACEVLKTSWTQSDPSDGETASGGATADTNRCWNGAIGFFDSNGNATTGTSATGLIFGNYVELSGNKFYDANANRTDDGEPGIEGFQIKIYGCSGTPLPCDNLLATVATDSNGDWSYVLKPSDLDTYFNVCEVVPQCYDWMQTYPDSGGSACHLVQLGTTGVSALAMLDFGNVCKYPPGFLTPGFWSNRNGEAVFLSNGSNLGLINGLSLVQLDGSGVNFSGNPYDPPNNPELDDWLTSESNCSNAANCLSVHLAAIELNCNNLGAINANLTSCDISVTPKTSPPSACSGLVDGSGQVNISGLMAEANSELASCVSGGTCVVDPTTQQGMCMLWKKGAFDDLNNNRIKIPSPTPCPVTCTQ